VDLANPGRPPEPPARACARKTFRVVPKWFIGRVSERRQTAKTFHVVPNWFIDRIRG
jgi:hypothetical protein